MRYLGQGHEISVPLPNRTFTADDESFFQAAFNQNYQRLYQRILPNAEVEILTWGLTLTAPSPALNQVVSNTANKKQISSQETQAIFDPVIGKMKHIPVYVRLYLSPGDTVSGAALIVEDETSTFIPETFDAQVLDNGFIIIERKPELL